MVLRPAALLPLVALLAGCATVPASWPDGLAGDPDARAPGEDAAATEAGPAAALHPPAASSVPEPDAAADGAAREEETAREREAARIAARARTFLGRRGPFRAAGQTFRGDCSGLVQAVYTAEGVPLPALMQQAAPDEPAGVKAQWAVALERGAILGADAQPQPGDLVFWDDTYDKNRNRKADDPLTHVGIVERVAGATVHFIHRGAHGVARGVMTLSRMHEARDEDGTPLNSRLRARSHPVRTGGLAAELFAGFGRLEAPLAVAVRRAAGPGRAVVAKRAP